MMDIKCNYCGKPTRFVDSALVYHGHSYGMIYYCADCQAWVGVHKGTDRPKGRLANEELRIWKIRAHGAFDPIWTNRKKKRSQAYKWLAEQMGLPEDETHIGMFDVEQCQQLDRICKGDFGL